MYCSKDNIDELGAIVELESFKIYQNISEIYMSTLFHAICELTYL